MRLKRRGILLAGGVGARLAPATHAISKQLLPVYDKPMVYYPLTTLMLAGLREVLIIATPEDLPRFRRLMEDGRQWGMALDYAIQPHPRGIAEALILAGDYLADAAPVLILGDNLFHGAGLAGMLHAAAARESGATVFAYRVHDPSRYGVVGFDPHGAPVSIVEKPASPASRYAVTGLYFYDADAVEIARDLRPSARGELEITDLNRHYLEAGRLTVVRMGRGQAWLDMGTHESLLEGAGFVAALEKRQGLKIGSPEETAWRLGYIDDGALARAAQRYAGSAYGAYLAGLLDDPTGIEPA